MKVLFADHAPPKMPGVEFTPFDEVLSTSDVISLHAPLTPETRNLIGIKELRKMKRSAILINTSRGGLVDEAALVEALTQGLIGGAGFDMLTKEPPKDGNPLLDLRLHNFILTPHVAWASDGAMQFLADQLIDNMKRSWPASRSTWSPDARTERARSNGERRRVDAPAVLPCNSISFQLKDNLALHVAVLEFLLRFPYFVERKHGLNAWYHLAGVDERGDLPQFGSIGLCHVVLAAGAVVAALCPPMVGTAWRRWRRRA